jgi:hypothetical protein
VVDIPKRIIWRELRGAIPLFLKMTIPLNDAPLMGRKDSRDEMDSQVASSITQRFGNIRALAKSVFLNEFFNEIFEEIYYKFLYTCEKKSNPPSH